MNTEIDRRVLIADVTFAIQDFARKFLEPNDYLAIYKEENFPTWLEFAYIDPYQKMSNTMLTMTLKRLQLRDTENTQHLERMTCETIVYQMRNFAGLANSPLIEQINKAIDGDAFAKETIRRKHYDKTEKRIFNNIISSIQWKKLWNPEIVHLYRTNKELQTAALIEMHWRFSQDILEVAYDYLQYAYGSETSEIENTYVKGIISHLNSPDVFEKLKKEVGL